MKRVTLDEANSAIKDFVCALPLETGGVQLELDGRVVCTVVPPGECFGPDVPALVERARGMVRRSRERNAATSEETIEREVREAVEQVRRKNG
jgi:hypothetical protein